MKKNVPFSMVAAAVMMISAISSCTKTDPAFEDLPVVEAYLVPGQRVSVKISQKTPYDESVASLVTDINSLDVKVITGGTEYTLSALGDGVYADTTGAITVAADSTYSLRLSYGAVTATSETLIPVRPQDVTISDTLITMAQFDPENPSGNTHPDPIVITWSNPDDSYYLATVECMESDPVPIIKDSVPENDIFASQPVKGTEIEIQPMTFRYFGRNRIILFHINPEYSTFFMHQATSSQRYQDPPSNIGNGLGIFTGINADTLYIRIIQE